MGIKEIKSIVEPGRVLHLVYTPSCPREKRVNICPDDALLQIAEINLNDGDTFPAHYHLPTERQTTGTQESWCVISGQVIAYYYDLDGKQLNMALLEPGSLTITFAGGHTYKAVENNTLVYEFKNGPYLGIEKDKEFI